MAAIRYGIDDAVRRERPRRGACTTTMATLEMQDRGQAHTLEADEVSKRYDHAVVADDVAR